jgi:regulator of PEP synthase PpsR (kinase-PPPase family)
MTLSKQIIIISDGTGRTAKRLLDAVLAQYSDHEIEFNIEHTYQRVRTIKRADELLRKIGKDCLVILSIVSPNLSESIHESLLAKDIVHINILRPMLKTMRKFLGVDPTARPGLLQEIDDRYYDKIDAISYTAEHDDGRGYRIEEADLVLLGLSRTCKTPISMYMTCNYGIKVANIPVIPNEAIVDQLLERLSDVKHRVIFGLNMNPDALAASREERAELLGGDISGMQKMQDYLDLEKVREEIRFCRQLYQRQKWQTIDVTRRAIEEISREIIAKLGRLPENE